MERRRRHSFKPLIAFWIVLLGALGGGALTLQLTYTPPPPDVSKTDAVRRAEAEAARQLTAPKKPAPPSTSLAQPVSPGTIPPPNPALEVAAADHPDWQLPKVGPNGLTAAKYYAAPLPVTSTKSPAGMAWSRVALVVEGVGSPDLDQALSLAAIKALPGPVDIAYSAYIPDTPGAGPLAEAARQAGHECLDAVPMEPDLGKSEGNRALVRGVTPAQDAANLDYALSRVPGCVGATGASDGLSGDAFADSGQAFTDMVTVIQNRGLIYLDPRERSPNPPTKQPIFHVDVVIDRGQNQGEPVTSDDITQNLQRLEGAASYQGASAGAVGIINLASITGPKAVAKVQDIIDWINHAHDAGVLLVPLTSIPPVATGSTNDPQ
jgi:polysaccharide deacetylase 2 family uncharacterized protein YibQ